MRRVTHPALGLLAAGGVPILSSGNGPSAEAWVPEWASIVGTAMLSAIMLTSEAEVISLIARVAGDTELQKSVVGAARVRMKPLDLYLMLRGNEDE